MAFREFSIRTTLEQSFTVPEKEKLKIHTQIRNILRQLTWVVNLSTRALVNHGYDKVY